MVWMVVWLVVSFVVVSSAAGDAPVPDFPRPAALDHHVRFWRDIFAQRSIHEVVLHDALDPGRVYAVLDARAYRSDGVSAAGAEARLRRETERALVRLRLRLRRERGPRFDPATVRAQGGMRERFRRALRISGRYLPEMERIFRSEGLPVELTRLPLIESGFELRVRSHVGAAGIWQFMPRTGRLFMRVDALVDERRDPIVATRGAARFLRRLHERLGTWPLAITAYNHGPTGVARAVRTLGTRDIGTIVRRYDGPAFGFASRNFYAEFLAALDVEREGASHFGVVERDAPLPCRERRLAAPVHIREAARRAGVRQTELVRLNPALADAVVAGRRRIPAGYALRLPATDVAVGPPSVARRSATTYRVQRGDTLSHIARRHSTTVAALRRLNGLRRNRVLRVGQRLRIDDSAVGG